MPNIIEYSSKSGITPSDKGINAAEQAAVVYQRTGNKISGDIERTFNKIEDKVERHEAIMETSELYKTGTELEINLQKRYEEESALPENRNSPYFGDRFMSEISPLLDEWGAGAKTDHGKQLANSLKASIRNKIFNHVAAGQAEMDAANVDDSVTQTGSNLASGLVLDPSEQNLRTSLGTMEAAINGMTAMISDVGMRERAATEYKHRFNSELVMHRYTAGIGQAITNQIAETGGETSPALEQLNKDIEGKVGFEHLSAREQEAVRDLGEKAVTKGQQLFNSRNATAKAQMVESGNAAFAQIYGDISKTIREGHEPTPDQIDAVDRFTQAYGGTNTSQVTALNNYITQAGDRAQRNAVQPFNQQTRDNIQAGFSLPSGDPRRPTQASLLRDYSSGLITKEDLSGFSEILNRLDQPEKDPGFNAAWSELKRWQGMLAQDIGGPNMAGTTAARSQFLHDSTANFMALGRASGNWEGVLRQMTDAKNPGSFINFLTPYQKAARYPYAAKLLARDLPTWNADNTLTWPSGSGGNRPAAPASTPAAPAQSPAADLQKADEFLWGKK